MLRHRLATAAVAIPIELAVVYLGGWPLAAFVALVVVLGLREFYQLAGHIGEDGQYGIEI